MNKLIFISTILFIMAVIWMSPNDLKAALSEPDKALLASRNMLKNPGFELGKSGWSASGGTYTTTTTAANLGEGTTSGSWDSSSAAQTLTSTAVAIPAGMYGRNGVATCIIQGASATHTLEAYDGSSIVATGTINSSAAYTRTSINFIFPSSGNLSLRLVSVASNEPAIFIDSCYLGSADTFNVSQVSQAQFIGSAYIPATASCAPARTNTALGAFSTSSTCPGPTVELNPGPGTIQTTDTDLPKFTVNNLPPGYYEVKFSFTANQGASADGTFAINDGTTTSGAIGLNTSSGNESVTVVGSFTYTTTANRTFELYGSASSSSITVQNGAGNGQIRFSIVKYPSSPETAFRPDVSDATAAKVWSYDGGAGSAAQVSSAAWTTFSTNTFNTSNFTNFGTAAACTTANDFCVKVPSMPAGKYEVTVMGPFGTQASTNCGYAVFDGTTRRGNAIANNALASTLYLSTLVGYFEYSSTQTNVEFKVQGYRTSGSNACDVRLNGTSTVDGAMILVRPIRPSISSPLLVNSVVSDSSGVEKITRAEVSVTGVVSNESGDWINGNCALASSVFTCTLNSGIFTGTPVCQATVSGATAGAVTSTPASSTSVVVRTFNSTTATAADRAFSIMCQGPK